MSGSAYGWLAIALLLRYAGETNFYILKIQRRRENGGEALNQWRQ